MAEDLIVQAGTTLDLDENSPQALSGALKLVTINSLQDLVDVGLVRDGNQLGKLLGAAQKVTDAAIRDRSRYTPPVRVHGKPTIDLRRFGDFRAEVVDTPAADAEIFWRVVRSIPPLTLNQVSPATQFETINNRHFWVWQALFQDVQIEANAVLRLTKRSNILSCQHLRIFQTGRIICRGTTFIRAFSIQGNL